MNSKELRQAAEWARHQSKTVFLEPPDREPGEPPATQEQLSYIRSLVKSIDETPLATLGRWQASSLIEQIEFERDIFTQELVEEYTGGPRKHKSPRLFRRSSDPNDAIVAFIMTVVAVLLIVRFSTGSWISVWELFQ